MTSQSVRGMAERSANIRRQYRFTGRVLVFSPGVCCAPFISSLDTTSFFLPSRFFRSFMFLPLECVSGGIGGLYKVAQSSGCLALREILRAIERVTSPIRESPETWCELPFMTVPTQTVVSGEGSGTRAGKRCQSVSCQDLGARAHSNELFGDGAIREV